MATNKKKEKSPRLILELVPASMWGKNVRAVISRENWDALRWGFYATTTKPEYLKIRFDDRILKSSVECRICGSESDNLELHEQWNYNDKHLVQRLIGFIPICSDCHLSMHHGRARQLGLDNKARQHLLRVNQWTERQARRHINDAFEKWMQRSKHQYTLDLDWLHQWIPESKLHLDWLGRPDRWVGDRLDAIAWAREILESDAIIVDTETTGLLDYSRAEVIELAVLTMRGKTVYRSRFRPRYRIPKRTTAIHGITDEDVRNAPTFKNEYENIFNSIHSRTVIAYKAEFDKGVISNTCGLYKLESPECRWECAMHAWRTFQESGKWLPLPGAKHNALEDCRSVLKLLRQMAMYKQPEKPAKKRIIKKKVRGKSTASSKNPRPSDVTDSYWLHAERNKGTYPVDSEHAGKWLIFVPPTLVDEIWVNIRRATEEGKLGSSAKVATARPNPNATNSKKVICVYTYDWTDKSDVKRIRKKLRQLGVTFKIPYKADQDTASGAYANRGKKHISKYYE